MKISRAVEIMAALREGFHPVTGELLDPEEACQDPQVIRALFTVAPILARAARPRPTNAGKPWTDADDELLAEAFDGGASERDLARTTGRSLHAVRMRLSVLGKTVPEPPSMPPMASHR